MIQVVSIFGALMILIAYTANQFGWMAALSLPYAVANAAGAATLTVVAALEEQWGFLLLEGVWTLVSLIAIVKLTRGRKTPALAD